MELINILQGLCDGRLQQGEIVTSDEGDTIEIISENEFEITFSDGEIRVFLLPLAPPTIE